MMRLIVTAGLAGLLAATVSAAGVVKVKFTTADGFFITGSSKTVGNGSQYTVCNFYDAATGTYLGQTEEPGVAFDNEAALMAHCDSLAPR
jgi:hypothetical protein